MGRLVAWGAGLTGLLTVTFRLVWGSVAVLPTVTFGLLATAIQVAAVMLVRPVWSAPYADFLRGWAMGMGLRLLGVAAIVVAVLADRDRFPPMPTAFAFLGVLIPLLFTETRFVEPGSRNPPGTGGRGAGRA